MHETDIDDVSTLPSTLTAAGTNPKATKSLKKLQNKVQHFVVRYVGTFASTADRPRNPWDRYVEDMMTRNARILAAFQQILEGRHPAIAEAVEVHLFSDASYTFSPRKHAKHNQDSRERYIIEYFDHSTLLNRQHGGYLSDYVPSTDDHDAFLAMQVQFYFRLHNNAGITPSGMMADVKHLFGAIQQFARDNASTGTCKHPFTDILRNAMAAQAQPSLYRMKHVILVVLGKDLTLDNYLREVSFYDGGSQAGTATRDLLQRTASAESECVNGAQSWDSNGFSTQIFPFSNLWDWLNHVQPDAAAGFMKTYLSIAKPLICASFARDVNDYTLANFVHSSGVPGRTFIEFVGVPTLQFHDTTTSKLYDPESAYIDIPHYHPGADKYTAYQQGVRRVRHMTWQLTQLFGHIMMDYIDALEKKYQSCSRQRLCEAALKKFNSCRTLPKYKPFFDMFAAAK